MTEANEEVREIWRRTLIYAGLEESEVQSYVEAIIRKPVDEPFDTYVSETLHLNPNDLISQLGRATTEVTEDL